MSDADEVETKLDLAKAYLDMGDFDEQEILAEVLKKVVASKDKKLKHLLPTCS